MLYPRKGALQMQLNKNYTIISKQNGKFLETAEDSKENGVLAVLNIKKQEEAQTWEISDAGDGYCKLRNCISGKMLDVIAGSSENGAWLHQWESADVQSQLWKLESLEDGSYKILSKQGGKCLEIALEDQKHLQIWQDTNAESQKWILEPVDEKSQQPNAIEEKTIPKAPTGRKAKETQESVQEPPKTRQRKKPASTKKPPAKKPAPKKSAKEPINKA